MTRVPLASSSNPRAPSTHSFPARLFEVATGNACDEHSSIRCGMASSHDTIAPDKEDS